MIPILASFSPSLDFNRPLCGQVQKIAPGPNKTVCEILWCAAAAPRIEWYLNNTRQRHSMCIERLSLLPTGTTSNEALHAEINAWFRQTQARFSADYNSSRNQLMQLYFVILIAEATSSSVIVLLQFEIHIECY